MTKAKATSPNDTENPIRVLKEATCPTTSGKSTLSYQVGTDDTGESFFKIVKASGGGFWSAEWVPYKRIKAAFDSWPSHTPLTSAALAGIFRGRSSNNSSFLLGVIRAEGLVEPMEDRQRCHQLCDPSRFVANMDALRKDAGIATTRKPEAKPKAKTPASKTVKAKAAPKENAVRKTK